VQQESRVASALVTIEESESETNKGVAP
jgi:hypothetical protein